jgi:hypothetical protein
VIAVKGGSSRRSVMLPIWGMGWQPASIGRGQKLTVTFPVNWIIGEATG